MTTFLDLPPELRNAIYREVLRLDDEQTALEDPHVSYFLRPYTHSRLIPTETYHALTQTSTQIRLETIPMFYANTSISIAMRAYEHPDLSPAFTRGDGDVGAWALVAPEAAISSIRNLSLTFTNTFFDIGIAALGHLSPGNNEWGEHVARASCGSCHPSDHFAWTIDFLEGAVYAPRKAYIIQPCTTCQRLLRGWLDSLALVDGRRQLTRERLLALAWPSEVDPKSTIWGFSGNPYAKGDLSPDWLQHRLDDLDRTLASEGRN